MIRSLARAGRCAELLPSVTRASGELSGVSQRGWKRVRPDQKQIDLMDIDAAFESAAAHVPSVVGSLSDGDKLRLYGLYKQATEGSCTAQRPSFLDRKARAKWSAWHTLGDLARPEAKAQYVELVKQLCPGFEPASASKEQRRGDGGMGGPVFSTMAESSGAEEASTVAAGSVHDVAAGGDVAALGALLASRPAARDERDEDGCTPLHWAADRGRVEVARLLLDRGADVAATNHDKQTPLHYAALCEHKEVCLLLLAAGADSEQPDAEGQTARSLSQWRGDFWGGDRSRAAKKDS